MASKISIFYLTLQYVLFTVIR